MAFNLTREEHREIIRLYESGKSFKEIKEITGRSREAQIKILTYCGLYEKGTEGLIWDEARRIYGDEARRIYGDHGDYYDWSRKLPSTERDKYYQKARPIVLERCRSFYNRLMAGSSINAEDIQSNKCSSENISSPLINWSPSHGVTFYKVIGEIAKYDSEISEFSNEELNCLINEVTNVLRAIHDTKDDTVESL